VGQAGCKIGNATWELYCLEQGITLDGRLNSDSDGAGVHTFFKESGSGRYTPRALMIDLDPYVIDEAMTGRMKGLYNPKNLLSGKEDAANNYARGRGPLGWDLLEAATREVEQEMGECDHLQGLFIYHSLGGGTGSGFHVNLLEYLKDQYPKLPMIEYTIVPSPKVTSAVVEPYNAVLSAHATMDLIDCAMILDNEALYEISEKNLDIPIPNHNEINRIVAQAISSISASLRFDGVLNADFSDFHTNLVPFPRLHSLIISYAPLISLKRSYEFNWSVSDITWQCFTPENFMIKADTERNPYMACCLLYRGDVTPKDINKAILNIKEKRCLKFVDWSPTGFKVGINYQKPVSLCTETTSAQKAVCMISNSTAVRDLWKNLTDKYDKMLCRGAFTHWYIDEGMEPMEFENAYEDIISLQYDYFVASQN